MDRNLQRIKIAEFCGWLDVKYRYCIVTKQYTWLSGLNPKPYLLIKGIDAETGEEREPNEADYGWDSLPDYLYDLDAMHEAEKALNHDQLLRYWGQLMNICGDRYRPILATAAQRAEAFLKTIGLWEKE